MWARPTRRATAGARDDDPGPGPEPSPHGAHLHRIGAVAGPSLWSSSASLCTKRPLRPLGTGRFARTRSTLARPRHTPRRPHVQPRRSRDGRPPSSSSLAAVQSSSTRGTPLRVRLGRQAPLAPLCRRLDFYRNRARETCRALRDRVPLARRRFVDVDHSGPGALPSTPYSCPQPGSGRRSPGTPTAKAWPSPAGTWTATAWRSRSPSVPTGSCSPPPVPAGRSEPSDLG